MEPGRVGKERGGTPLDRCRLIFPRLVDSRPPATYCGEQFPSRPRHDGQSNRGVIRHPAATTKGNSLTDGQITFARLAQDGAKEQVQSTLREGML
jgi:hypothetical protein